MMLLLSVLLTVLLFVLQLSWKKRKNAAKRLAEELIGETKKKVKNIFVGSSALPSNTARCSVVVSDQLCCPAMQEDRGIETDEEAGVKFEDYEKLYKAGAPIPPSMMPKPKAPKSK